jgi:hypothetical protein
MALTITKGHTFNDGDILLATNLHKLIESATISGITASELASDSVSSAKIQDNAITSAKILASAVGLTKLADLGSMTVIGNVTGVSAGPAEVSILDEDDMASDSDTALATQQSIKKYVDDYGGGSVAKGQSYTITGTGEATGEVVFTSGTNFIINAALSIDAAGPYSSDATVSISIERKIDNGSWAPVHGTYYGNCGEASKGHAFQTYFDASPNYVTSVRYRAFWLSPENVVSGRVALTATSH